MKLHTLFFSPTKNTKRIIEAIAKGMGLEAIEHDITLPQDRYGSIELGADDCLVVGLPVYSGRIPAITESFLTRVQGKNTPVILIAVYGNKDYIDSLLEMKDIFTKQGFVPLAAAAFIGEHSFTDLVATGRPDAADLEQAEAFGRQAADLLAGDNLDKLRLQVKGNRPYKERSATEPCGPNVKDNCNLCGICVAHCPAAALSLADVVEVQEERCLHCHACVKICPRAAISFDNKWATLIIKLKDNYSARQEPEMIWGKI